MATSLIPAPGPPGVTLAAAVMVMRIQLLGPFGSRSGWAAPVAVVLVTAFPAAEVTVSCVASAREPALSSSRIVAAEGRFRDRPKLIWIHCPTGVA